MTLPDNVQQQFLQKVKALSADAVSFADELAEVLNLSTDSVYRRMRGETVLSLDEALAICRHYKISLDSLETAHSGIVTFQYQLLNSLENYNQYWQTIADELQRVRQGNGTMVYVADDIPIFHHFQFPEHAAFKFFCWMRSILNISELANQRFSFDKVSPDLLALGKRIYETYREVNSVEIWTEESANATLNQIEYYWESGLFENPEDAVVVCEQLTDILSVIQTQAAQKSKKHPDNFTLYQSELQLGNNCVLVTMGTHKRTYLRHQTLNTMNTSHPVFCAESEAFLQSLTQKSILLSGVSEKQRHRFFSKLQQKVQRLHERINKGPL
jgi:hypothetical protein